MTLPHAPQPIPYQGSKRRLAPRILRYLPADTDTLYEPFAGSGAISVGAAMIGGARRFVLSDSLAPLVGLWQGLLTDPDGLARAYEVIWTAARADPAGSYTQIRDQFNRDQDPVKLLYLIARCVKNAVRFNAEGRFNQSPDHRRLGMRPALLRARAAAVHALLGARARARCADYALSLREAGPADVLYLDPPYLGVSGTRDARYHQGLDLDRFLAELRAANRAGLSFLLSFDGRCGERAYGPALPADLGLRLVELPAGRSSQATLSGRVEETVESLYLSPALVARLGAGGAPPPG